jgi:uncharacterized protein YggE
MDEWKKLQSVIKLFGILASIFIIALTVYTFKAMGFIGSVPATNTISVSGHGESFAVPNIATVSFSVEKTAKTVADAQNQVTTVMNDVLATLKTNGIADKDIQTTSYDVNPKYDYQNSVCTINICPPSKQILTGYTVSDTVEVKIRAIDTAGTIIGVLGQKNVTNLSGLTLTVEDDSTVKTEARNKAITQAKQQADAIAKGLGVRLVRITSFSESGSAQPIYYSAKNMMLSSGAAAPTPSIPVGQNTASSDVTITYEIQ